jgi:hypothetical protein
MRAFSGLVASVLVSGCALHLPSAAALGETRQVAFIARIDDNAGPHSTVFRDDGSYAEKLKRLSPEEADRRLGNALTVGSYDKQGELSVHTISRFEFADSLRSNTLALLPKTQPWTRVVHPVKVARVLESFLVQEVPANAPDYERLKSLGADTVMEIVIEDYGMRSHNGVAGVFVLGFARMFRIDGGEMYRRSFISDDLNAGLPHLDPFEVRKNADLFSARIRQMVTGIAMTVAKDLTLDVSSAAPAKNAPVETQPQPTSDQPPSDDPL